jgi:hypothetical protein
MRVKVTKKGDPSFGRTGTVVHSKGWKIYVELDDSKDEEGVPEQVVLLEGQYEVLP